MCNSVCWNSKRGIYGTFTYYPSTSLPSEFCSYVWHLDVDVSFLILDPNYCHYFDYKFPACDCFSRGRILSSSLFPSSWSLRNEGWCRVIVILDIAVGGSDWSSLRMLSYSLSTAVAAVLAGFIISKTGLYRPVVWFGYTLSTVGMGLMTMLAADSST